MECKDDGQKARLPSAIDRRKIGRKRRAGDAGGVQLAFATSVPYPFPTLAMHVNQVPNYAANLSTKIKFPDQNLPFMNNMDEISYWVYTKRAPCLLNYDNLIKWPEEQAHCSKGPASIPSEKPTPKKRRKLKLLDDDSISSEKKQNVFFETPQHVNNKTGKKSCRSESHGSNVDFNIKSSQVKPKLQRKSKGASKTNNVITSTPKVTNLRRSLRKKQTCNNNNSHLNNSLEIFDASAINGHSNPVEIKSGGNNKEHVPEKVKDVTHNGRSHFEDESDVSGFTANYIRSTKLQSAKATPKSRSKNGKAIVKNQKDFPAVKEKIVVCVNKSMNTGISKPVLNCSTDSSQNIINLVTVKDNEISNKVDRSTSLLKFVDTKDNQDCVSDKKTNKTKFKNLNISFQSKSSGASRYPKRNNNISLLNSDEDCSKNKKSKSTSLMRTPKKQSHTDQMENTVNNLISRTRSGKKIGLDLDLEMSGCSIIQINNCTEPVSSSVAVNVATCTNKSNKRLRSSLRNSRKRISNKKVVSKDSESETSDKKLGGVTQDSLVQRPIRSGRLRKSCTKPGDSLQRDSLRDKSGFAACFSDSDSDNEPLQHRKFFY